MKRTITISAAVVLSIAGVGGCASKPSQTEQAVETAWVELGRGEVDKEIYCQVQGTAAESLASGALTLAAAPLGGVTPSWWNQAEAQQAANERILALCGG